MKNQHRFVLFSVVLLAVLAVLFFGWHNADRKTPASPSPASDGASAPPGQMHAGEERIAATGAGNASPGESATPASASHPVNHADPHAASVFPAAAPFLPADESGETAPLTPIGRILRNATVVAGPTPGSGGIVRVVRDPNGKYPLLRVEQPAADASDGVDVSPTVSVADHFIVKKQGSMSEQDFREEIARRGYSVRKKMLASDSYIVAFKASPEAELLEKYPRVRAELSGIGRVEPDYVVEAFAAPNDSYRHLLWGMHNATGRISVTSGSASGAAYDEGGKMSYSGEIPTAGIAGAPVNCGFGAVAGDFPPGVSGNIALIQRGSADASQVTFATKVTNARRAGATAVLIYNNVAEGFSGTLSTFKDADGQPWLPVVPLTQSDGQALVAALPATVTLVDLPSGKDISAREAWDTQTGSTNVLVGIIDTGIDYNHPDLAANIWTNPGEIAGNGIDDDGNGFVDDVHGWDFSNDDNDPMDDHNHGTHCAGTIGGTGNNALGVVGVNWRVKMAAIKFLNSGGSGYDSDGVDCVYYGTRIGVRLTSNSWGGGNPSETMRVAIADANTHGILFVAAAGNSKTSTPMYPAGYDNDNIISVAATDSADQLADFSNYGLPHVDLAAPGVGILSTVRAAGYAFFNGTSMACPHVAGAAALLIAQSPSLPHLDLKARLQATVDPIKALTGKCVTGGRLNVAAALAGLSEAPVLTLTATAVADTAPGGNGDGVINPGETISLRFTVNNSGYQAATDVTATFSVADSYATVTDSNCVFGTIARRSAATAADPVTLTIAAGTPVPYTVAGTLTLTDAAARTWVLPVTLLVSTTYHLSGTVTLDGAGLPGASVAYTGQVAGAVTTGVGGVFDIAVPVGAFSLVASYGGTELSKTAAQEFTTPGDHTNITFGLTNATISGTVIDKVTGSPVPGATVTLEGPITETFTPAANGLFSSTHIYGRETSWTITAKKPGAYLFPSSPTSVTVPPNATAVSLALGKPKAVIDIPSFQIDLAPGNSTTRTITLSNSGAGDLRWSFSGIVNPSGTPGQLFKQFVLPSALNTYPEGVAHDGQFLYAYDGVNSPTAGTLYKIDPDADPVAKPTGVVETFYIPDIIPGFPASQAWLGCHDGDSLWFQVPVPIQGNPDRTLITLQAIDLTNAVIVRTLSIDPKLFNQGYSGDHPLDDGSANIEAFGDNAFWFRNVRRDRDTGQKISYITKVDAQSGDILLEFRQPDALVAANTQSLTPQTSGIEYSGGALWLVQNHHSNVPASQTSVFKKVFKIDPQTGAVLGTLLAPQRANLGIVADRTGALCIWSYFISPGTTRYLSKINSGEGLWLSANQVIGKVAEDGSAQIEITFDTTLLNTGVYHGAICISSNDPQRPNVYVPVVLNVTAGTPGNNPPVINTSSPASPVTLNENTSQAFTIAASDPNGDPITKQWAVDGLVVGGNTLSYTFNANYFSQGAHAIAVSARDGKGGVAMKAWQIYVNNVNRAPVASNATYTVANSDSLTFSIAATDPDNEELTWTILSTAASGTLTGTAPNFVYTPAAGFIGPVSFTFKVNDGAADSNTGTVTINVGYRNVYVDTTPLVVTAASGAKPTRTVTLRNLGTTPLRWALPMTWNNKPAQAGSTLQTLNALPVPSGTTFYNFTRGLAYDGTNLLASVREISGTSGGSIRGHLVRYDPATGAQIGPTLPAPTSSGADRMHMYLLSCSGSSVWVLNTDWVDGLTGRIFEFGLGATDLTLRTQIMQLPMEIGIRNMGVAWSSHGLWVSTATVYSSEYGTVPGGIFRIAGTLDKTVLDQFDLPADMNVGGPIAYWNGALWLGNYESGPLRKINPFTGAVLATVPLAANVKVTDMAEDRVGGMFLRDNADYTQGGAYTDSRVYRVHSGDYALMTPFAGYLNGGTDTNITVTFDTVLAGPGTHTGNLHLLSDDPDQPDLLIPYTFTVLAQETFTAWAARMLPTHSSADRLPGANPDRDSNANIVEFALGTNPGKGDVPPWFKGWKEDGQYVFSADLSATATGVTVGWKTSEDLVYWIDADPVAIEILDLGAAERRTMRFDLAPGQQRLFLKMEAGQ